MVDRCASIRSSTRSSTCGQIDVRRSAPGGRAGQVAGRLAQRRHVLDRHDDLQVERLLRRRLDDRDRAAAGEERRDLVDRPHGGREPDALGWCVEQGIEAFE